MQNKDVPLEIGFTLSETLLSLLLLAIIAIGSFQTFQFSQNSSNSNLVKFRRLHKQQQLTALEKLKQTYANISVNNGELELLECLITHQDVCELIP